MTFFQWLYAKPEKPAVVLGSAWHKSTSDTDNIKCFFCFSCGYPAIKTLIHSRTCKQTKNGPNRHLNTQFPTNFACYFPTTKPRAENFSMMQHGITACYNARDTNLCLKKCRSLRPSEVQKDALGTRSEHRISNRCSPGSRWWLGSVFCWCFWWCIVEACTYVNPVDYYQLIKKAIVLFCFFLSCEAGKCLYCLWFFKFFSTLS